jgi:hypothetical protein
MRKHSVIRLYALVLTALAGTVSPAVAQYQSQASAVLAIGESFHIEGAAGFWSPSADMSISAESLGIPGDRINFKQDLGLTDQRFRELRIVLKPARKHKFRFQYIPIKYEQSAVVNRDLVAGDNCLGIIYLGLCYRVNLPVNSEIDWKAYRFGYEYDFLTRDRFFIGFVADAKYTDVQATLASPGVIAKGHASAPIPAIGGIVRGYVTPHLSITGELTGIYLPNRAIEDVKAHYLDVDFYGTYNFTRNVGAQIGFRSFDLGYVVDKDLGDFDLRGIYFGIVARY